MNFSIKDFFNKCDQIHKKLRIWSDLTKKFLVEKIHFFVQWFSLENSQRILRIPLFTKK